MSKELFGDSKILISLDSETLSRWDDAVMLSFSMVGAPIDQAISFEQLCNEALFVKLDAKEQKDVYKHRTDKKTIDWWRNNPSVEAKNKSLKPTDVDCSVKLIPLMMKEWMDKMGFDFKTAEYADRNLFDWNKLQYIFETDLQMDVPWNYHNQLDFSSVFKAWGMDRYAGIYPNDIPARFKFVYHNPVHDAALDWLRMQHAMVKLGIIEFPDNYIFNGLFYEIR